MFGLWLADNGHSHEVDVQADARNVAKVFQKSDGNCRAELCETVDKLSDILNTDNFQKHMKKFGEKCGCKSKCRRFDAVTRWLDTSIGFVMHASYRNCKCCLSISL